MRTRGEAEEELTSSTARRRDSTLQESERSKLVRAQTKERREEGKEYSRNSATRIPQLRLQSLHDKLSQH